MTQRSSDAPGGATAMADADDDLVVLEATRVPDLPGMFIKRAVLGPEETGFITSNGSVVSELSRGSNKAGWSFFGWFGGGNREVVKLHNRPFRLRLYFTGLLSKGYDNLDAMIHLTVSVREPSLSFNRMGRGMVRLSASQLASRVAASMDDLLQVKVTEIDGQALRHDRQVQHRLSTDLEPTLNRALDERGVNLESVDLVAFHNPGEGDELLDELADADRIIASGTKPGREEIQRTLTRLQSTGLATPEMAERAQLLYDGGTNDAFFGVMKDISRASRRRLEARLADRSEQLTQKLDGDETSSSSSGPLSLERWMKFVGPICAIIGLVYKFAFTGFAGGPIVLIGGLIGAVAFAGGYLMIRAKRILGIGKQDEIVIRLDRWAKKNSMATDDLIRRQMGVEFSNSLTDVKDAKLVAFREDKKSVADALNDLENRMDLLRTEVVSAPAASSIVSVKNFPTQRISRMVSFEEELLRQARNLSIRSQTAKESLTDEDVEALRVGLDGFQRSFSKRLGLLEGFKDL
ncbi:MAG: hypothetical protein BZY88_05605 [SAR202 cluster bacterium Io17-Chloro-G9]|nr:MAG: hypothetical protein BZY88_05605 [SAR202 cluster bacterium Io17-Chloro-G9]